MLHAKYRTKIYVYDQDIQKGWLHSFQEFMHISILIGILGDSNM